MDHASTNALALKEIEQLLNQSFTEDLSQEGDITSQFIFTQNPNVTAVIRSKQNGILSGIEFIEQAFSMLDKRCKTEICIQNGQKLYPEMVIAQIYGPIQAILAAERTVLNILGRLSGIATKTATLVSLIADTETKLLDTRKTTPGLRLFEKRAVVHGGGFNHRFGLFDMVLIKDTHVQASGGPAAAIKACKAKAKQRGVLIEVEVQSFEQCIEAAAEGPDRIMLDNMDFQMVTQCCKYVKHHFPEIKLEASGNVSETTITRLAQCGVDYISVGAITHSAPVCDVHLIITDQDW